MVFGICFEEYNDKKNTWLFVVDAFLGGWICGRIRERTKRGKVGNDEMDESGDGGRIWLGVSL